MKVICDRGALVEALNLAGAVVASRTPKPVLTCVKLSATADGPMTVASTDLEVALHRVVSQVQVQEAGDAVVSAEKLGAIVRESADPTLTVETEQDTTHVRGEDSHFKIFGYPPGDFPPVGQLEGEVDFQIDAGQLVQMINRTLFATARENSRYAYKGVLLEREGKKLTMVATDGHRLPLVKGTCQSPVDETTTAIIPTKALNLLTRLLDDPEETVKVKLTENQALFATEAATVTTNLVEGTFPPYQDVIPREHDRKAAFNTDVLASGLRRAALLTNEESRGVKMAFSPDKLVLSSRAPETGEAEVTVPVESYNGEPIEIGFNPHFVIDALKVVDAKQVTMEFKASNKPGVLRAGSEFLYVIMPLRLN